MKKKHKWIAGGLLIASVLVVAGINDANGKENDTLKQKQQLDLRKQRQIRTIR